MISDKQKTTLIFAVPGLLILTAFFANLFAEGWNWSSSDFLLAAVFLSGTAFSLNRVIRSQEELLFKLIICFMILLVLAVLWIELAVGIFGSPFAGS